MLLCDSTSKVVRTQNVLEYIKSLRKINIKSTCEEELKNSIVLTRYNNKTYRISGISWSKSLNDTMEGNISFLDYYVTNYPKEKITDKKQPLLISKVKIRGKEQTIYLVPELPFLTGLSEQISNNSHSTLRGKYNNTNNYSPS